MVAIALMDVHQIPARKNNYIYMLDDRNLDHCAVIDATDFTLIKNYCDARKKRLSAIFVTHHHEDHINAIAPLVELYQCEVYVAEPDAHRISDFTKLVNDNDIVFYGPHALTVFSTPGHTTGHISYFDAKDERLFCGDVIFRFGCGRLFEGSPKMMLATLARLRQLPDSTLVYCAHEYTQTNVSFCQNLEPQNEYVNNFRQAPPTVPFRLKEQKDHSPFLRWDDPNLQALLNTTTDVETFAKLRHLRNHHQ
jgi:hydroxyacylglutathione hydrolase